MINIEFTVLLDQALEYMHSGGFVMWPLAVMIMILWYALGYRYHVLNRGSKKSVRTLIRKFQEGKRDVCDGLIDRAIIHATGLAIDARGCSKTARYHIDDAFDAYERHIKQGSVIIMTIVRAAPLVGLLGTVIGMIETFDSLASASLFSQSGGIAGGISQALFTTQLGLVVAVPGLIAGRLLDNKADNMLLDLEQIKDIICLEPANLSDMKITTLNQ